MIDPTISGSAGGWGRQDDAGVVKVWNVSVLFGLVFMPVVVLIYEELFPGYIVPKVLVIV